MQLQKDIHDDVLRLAESHVAYINTWPIRRRWSLNRLLVCDFCDSRQRGWLLFMWRSRMGYRDQMLGPKMTVCRICCPTKDHCETMRFHLFSTPESDQINRAIAEARRNARASIKDRPWLFGGKR